jgi:glyoxylase-like metal-dependent hydrolase (beta-lactamase superfamily II)
VSVAISRLVLGPLLNNVYLLGDEDSKDAVVIDPSFEPQRQAAEIRRRGWRLRQIWLTHGHFDHIEGVAALQALFEPAPLLGMHPAAEAWARTYGQKANFGFAVSALPPVDIQFFGGQRLAVTPESGTFFAEVRETPGHSPGSVIFYCPDLQAAFVGDAIFRGSIGRTDLAGGDYPTLISAIRTQIFTLPDDTVLFPGHGPESSVGYEKANNPFLL